MDDYGLLEAIRLADLSQIKSIFQRKTRDKLRTQQLILSTLQRTSGGNRDVPLLLAATVDDVSILAYFVTEYEVDLNKSVEIDSSFREYTFPIISAIKSENLRSLDWILKNGGSAEVVDGKGWTPLHHAVAGLNYSIIRRLLKNSLKNIDQENSDGQTALHMATRAGHVEIVKLLINVGQASVGCARSIDGMAPIHVAAKEGNYHLVQLFCENFNVSAKSQYKCKSSDNKFYVLKGPIHVAASEGNASTIETLMKYCEANALDSVGNSPLHCCFMRKYDPDTMKPLEQYEDTVRILLQHGCDVSVVNVKNELASDLAHENGYNQVIEILHLPKKKLTLKGSKREKPTERPTSAVLLGAGSMGQQMADSSAGHVEEIETVETQKVRKVKSKSASKRLNASQQVESVRQSQKPKPLVRKSLSSEMLNQENTEPENPGKPIEKVKKTKAIGKTEKSVENDSEPELTSWLKEQAQLLKDKDNSDKTVPMAQSTPPPTKKSEKPISPMKSPKSIPMTNSLNIQKVKERPLPPPKPFKKPNFQITKVDTKNTDESDNFSPKDQSFESMEPIRPVPRPRRHPKTPGDETERVGTESFGQSPSAKPKTKGLRRNTENVDSTTGNADNKPSTVGLNKNKKAILPKTTPTQTVEKINGGSKNEAPKLNSNVADLKGVKRSPIKNNKAPVKIQPPLESSEDESDDDDDDDEDDDEEDETAKTNTIPNNNNNNKPSNKPKDKNIEVETFKKKPEIDESYDDEDEEEEDEDEEEEDDDDGKNSSDEEMNKPNEELLSIPYSIPTKTFTRTRSVEVTRNTDKKFGFSVAGGNHDGIFIHTVTKNATGNLKPGEQIVEINGRSIAGKTKEDVYKLFETLVQNSERIALVLSDEGSEIYREIVKNGGAGGDRFYVRAKFTHDNGKKRELKIREGEIFCVTDSLPDKYDGLWKAQRMSTTIRKNDDIGVGFIPNRQKADQIALKQHISTSSNSRNGAFLRSFRRAKSAEKLTNKGGRLNESADAFNTSLTIVGYERVLQAPPPLKKRPVIILGLFCDVVLTMLTQDSPALFFTPPSTAQLEILNAEFDDAPVDYQLMQRLMSLTDNNNNRHLLTIMSPAAIDFLMKKTTLDPIVIFISPVSKSVVKAVKAKLAPNFDRNPSHLYEEAAKFEKSYGHLFSSVVSYTVDNWWFFHLKEAITHNQQQNIWVPEELALIAQKRKQDQQKQQQQQQQQQVKTLHSSHGNLNSKKMMSQTFDNFQISDLNNGVGNGNNRMTKPKLNSTVSSNGPSSLPPRSKFNQQLSNPVPVTRKAEPKIAGSTPPIAKNNKPMGKLATTTINNNNNKNTGNKSKPTKTLKKNSDNEEDNDDDDDDDDEDEEDEESEEEEEEEEEEKETKPKQKQTSQNSIKKPNTDVKHLDSCPQAFGRDKRIASESTANKTSVDGSIPNNKINLDPPTPQNNKKPKNLFLRPNQPGANVSNASSGGGGRSGDASFDSDASGNFAAANKKLLFQRASSNASAKETPL